MSETRGGAPGKARRRTKEEACEPTPAQRRTVQQRAPRRDGWTPERRAHFFAELANSCNIKAACHAVGMSVGGAYMLRERDPSFRLGWRRGIAQGYAKLELQMLERALIGEKKLRVVLERSGDDERSLDLLSRYSARVAETLYRAHRADAIDYDLSEADPDGEDARTLIEEKVEKLRDALARKLERQGQRDGR